MPSEGSLDKLSTRDGLVPTLSESDWWALRHRNSIGHDASMRSESQPFVLFFKDRPVNEQPAIRMRGRYIIKPDWSKSFLSFCFVFISFVAAAVHCMANWPRRSCSFTFTSTKVERERIQAAR